MSLYLITGLPGTGKTTVCAELKERGLEAYDADQDHLAHWYDANGDPVKEEDEERTVEFVNAHTRDIALQIVEGLATQATDKTVFVCGDPENEDELQPLFTGIFALVLDESVRQDRLDTRTNNPWGKLPHEREYDRAHIAIAQNRYKSVGYSVISATQSVERIVDIIVGSVKT